VSRPCSAFALRWSQETDLFRVSAADVLAHRPQAGRTATGLVEAADAPGIGHPASLGAPEARSKGLWNNHGQCCGDAGVGDFALLMAARTGDPAYVDLARRCAAVILHRADKTAAGRRWVQAEHRDRPEFLEAQTGYMQSAAGIASFLIHLATATDGVPVKITMPDWPRPIR
jgi:hypothetical protein